MVSVRAAAARRASGRSPSETAREHQRNFSLAFIGSKCWSGKERKKEKPVYHLLNSVYVVLIWTQKLVGEFYLQSLLLARCKQIQRWHRITGGNSPLWLTRESRKDAVQSRKELVATLSTLQQLSEDLSPKKKEKWVGLFYKLVWDCFINLSKKVVINFLLLKFVLNFLIYYERTYHMVFFFYHINILT